MRERACGIRFALFFLNFYLKYAVFLRLPLIESLTSHFVTGLAESGFETIARANYESLSSISTLLRV